MMETFMTAVHVLVAIFMILVVLLQGGNQGGVGAALGGGNSTSAFGATGATSFFGKLTYAAAAIFMISSVWLTVLKSEGGDIGLSEQLKQSTEQAVPADATAPAEDTKTNEK
jgi:preprotein translocase subunit SecG